VFEAFNEDNRLWVALNLGRCIDRTHNTLRPLDRLAGEQSRSIGKGITTEIVLPAYGWGHPCRGSAWIDGADRAVWSQRATRTPLAFPGATAPSADEGGSVIEERHAEAGRCLEILGRPRRSEAGTPAERKFNSIPPNPAGWSGEIASKRNDTCSDGVRPNHSLRGKESPLPIAVGGKDGLSARDSGPRTHLRKLLEFGARPGAVVAIRHEIW